MARNFLLFTIEVWLSDYNWFKEKKFRIFVEQIGRIEKLIELKERKKNRFGACETNFKLEFKIIDPLRLLVDNSFTTKIQQASLDRKRRNLGNKRAFTSIRRSERLNFIISSKLIKLTIPLSEKRRLDSVLDISIFDQNT